MGAEANGLLPVRCVRQYEVRDPEGGVVMQRLRDLIERANEPRRGGAGADCRRPRPQAAVDDLAVRHHCAQTRLADGATARVVRLDTPVQLTLPAGQLRLRVPPR